MTAMVTNVSHRRHEPVDVCHTPFRMVRVVWHTITASPVGAPVARVDAAHPDETLRGVVTAVG